MKTLGLLCFLVAGNAMAFDEAGIYNCKNESKESSFTVVRTIDLYSSSLAYTGSEINKAGDSITFTKAGVSKSEVKVEKVSPGVYVGSLSVQYSKIDDASMDDLMTCTMN
jgi:hypothetical protein